MTLGQGITGFRVLGHCGLYIQETLEVSSKHYWLTDGPHLKDTGSISTSRLQTQHTHLSAQSAKGEWDPSRITGLCRLLLQTHFHKMPLCLWTSPASSFKAKLKSQAAFDSQNKTNEKFGTNGFSFSKLGDRKTEGQLWLGQWRWRARNWVTQLKHSTEGGWWTRTGGGGLRCFPLFCWLQVATFGENCIISLRTLLLEIN